MLKYSNSLIFLKKTNFTELIFYVSFSIVVLFSITKYLHFFHFKSYPLIDRVTWTLLFDNSIVSPLFDSAIIVTAGLFTIYFLFQKRKFIFPLIFLAIFEIILFIDHGFFLDILSLIILPTLLSLFLASHYSKITTIDSLNSGILVKYVTVIVFGFEFVVLMVWSIYPFSPTYIKESILWSPVTLEFEVFYSMARFAPFFVIFSMYWFITKPAVPIFCDFLNISRKRIKDLEFSPNVVFNPKIILAIAFAISIIFAVFPYFPTLNPDYTWRSVDDHSYQELLTHMTHQNGVLETIQSTFILSSGDRPLTLGLMYLIFVVTGLELVTVVRFFPLLLGPGLVFSVYFFVKTGTKNKQMASYAALLTTFSHQLLVGIYAGFFANWLGMIAAYFAFTMIYRFWNNPSLRNYLLVFGHSILSFLLYLYVDVYFLLTLLAFLIISMIQFRTQSIQRKKIFILSSIFGIYGGLFLLRILLGSSELFDSVFAREDVALSFTEFRNRWINFPTFMHYYVGGIFSNLAFLAFTVIWSIYAKINNTFDRIILASLLAGAIPIIFGDFVLQSRIFYDIPIQIPAAIAIYRIVNKQGLGTKFAKISFLLITIHFTIYAIRTLSNLTLSGTF